MPKASVKTLLPISENSDNSAVSVIVPIYNTSAYLAECLDSVLAQTFTDYETIRIDDGSTDKSLSIARNTPKKTST